MIKLWNHTPVPDKEIRDILSHAARRIGVKGDVAVKVIPARAVNGFLGFARSGWPYVAWMRCRPRQTYRKRNSPLVKCGRGYIEMALDCRRAVMDRQEIEVAQRFVRTALHEMSHIRDFREGVTDDGPLNARGYRIAHDRRPCEIRAENRVYDAMQGVVARRRIDELALSLAIALEQTKL